MSRYQRGRPKTNLDFTDARDGEWQWRQLTLQCCLGGYTQRKCTDTYNWRGAGSLAWPFLMLKYKCLFFQIKSTEAILWNSRRVCFQLLRNRSSTATRCRTPGCRRSMPLASVTTITITVTSIIIIIIIIIILICSSSSSSFPAASSGYNVQISAYIARL